MLLSTEAMTHLGYATSERVNEASNLFDVTAELGTDIIKPGTIITYHPNEHTSAIRIVSVEFDYKRGQSVYEFYFRLPKAQLINGTSETRAMKFWGTSEEFVRSRVYGDSKLKVSGVFMEEDVYFEALNEICEKLTLEEVYLAAAAFYSANPQRVNNPTFWIADESDPELAEMVDVVFGLYPYEWRQIITAITK